MLVDRTAERAVIDRLVDGTRRGASGVLVLRGPAGIGKSALLDYAASRASELAVARIVRWRRWWKPRDGVESQVVTSSGCVAQAWRGGGPREALLARLLRGVGEQSLNPDVSRPVGRLCAAAGATDVVDGHVAMMVHDHDIVLTTDLDDITALLRNEIATRT